MSGVVILLYTFQERFDLGNNRFVIVNRYNGAILIHIRQFEKFGEKLYPTKQGITLNTQQFRFFIDILDEINRDVQDIFNNKSLSNFKYNIGEGVYVTANVNFPMVHVRRFFQVENMPVEMPTKKGIALRLKEWDALVKFAEEVKVLVNLL